MPVSSEQSWGAEANVRQMPRAWFDSLQPSRQPVQEDNSVGNDGWTVHVSTPLRASGSRTDEGWVLLSDVGSSYRDGGEERVLEILRDSADVSSTSDEIFAKAENWAEHYHLSPTRSHLLRPLRLPADAAVLEVGAGCGAVTRYLGETCATVDALEPVPARARAARERTRDLPNVEIFVGEISDIPDKPAYDMIVVVGVLEYVGAGSADLAPYREFLDNLASRLKPTGALVLAIENKLGVKYFSGAAEDHTDRYFDGVEGYPEGGSARTFSRRELVDLLADSGLTAETVLAFPDYKMPRALFNPEKLTGPAESLLYRVPNFPSPDWVVPRAPVADEELVWRSLVQGGLAADTGNSFVALAGKGRLTDLWDPTVGGVFYSRDRRAAYAVQTRIVTGDGDIRLDRTRLSEVPWPSDLSVSTASAPFVPGTDLLDLFLDTDDAWSAQALATWRTLVVNADTTGGIPLDLLPHNLIVRPDGSLEPIDDEWRNGAGDIDDVLRRGALTLALRIATGDRNRGDWAGCQTYRDVAIKIGTAIGITEPDWLERALNAEAEFQAEALVFPAYQVSADSARDYTIQAFNTFLDAQLHSQKRLVERQTNLLDPSAADTLRHELHLARVEAHEMLAAAAAETDAYRAAARAAQRRVDALEAERGQLSAANSVLRSEVETFRNDVRHLSSVTGQQADELIRTRATISWRVTRPLRWIRRLGR